MKTLLIAGLAFGWAAAARAIDFEEAEGFQAGGGLEGFPEWTVDPGTAARVTGQSAAAGAQALEVGGGAVHFRSPAVPASGVRFIDLWVRPAVSSAAEAPVALHVWGADLGFLAGADGAVQVATLDGPGASAAVGIVATEARVREGRADRWLRLTLRQDVAARRWDLFVDGRLAAVNLGLDPGSLGELAVAGGEAGPVDVDAIGVTIENPLFKDTDRDGMPDAYESANGLDPNTDDRSSDPDGDGMSNIEEFRAHRMPGQPGVGSRHCLYVNNQIGNNAHTGALPYAAAGAAGPKASIKAAMIAAQDGDTIVVLFGKGIYQEDDGGTNVDKQLTIKPLGEITIQ